jgi:hypothetical protein
MPEYRERPRLNLAALSEYCNFATLTPQTSLYCGLSGNKTENSIVSMAPQLRLALPLCL